MKQNTPPDVHIILNRRSRILELINEQKQVKVSELSKKFKVSEVTIRNDLSQLEEKGLLIRARGGAFRADSVSQDQTLNIKLKKHQKEKQAIGKAAAALINEGETILLDSGTTTMEVARQLKNFSELTVITNALNIAIELTQYPQIKLIIPGGFLRDKSLSLVGPISENSIKNYYCDKFFIGVDGIDTEYGISTPNAEEAHLNKLMIKISRKVIVVTDSSKFLKRSFAFISDISDIDAIVTDEGIPEQEKIKLKDLGKDVVITPI
jgi:DeoR family transcriptional regulator of aga operon